MTNNECRNYWKSSLVSDIRPHLTKNRNGWSCFSDRQPDFNKVISNVTPECAFVDWGWWQNRAMLIKNRN